jgi:hypothetical protein
MHAIMRGVDILLVGVACVACVGVACVGVACVVIAGGKGVRAIDLTSIS